MSDQIVVSLIAGGSIAFLALVFGMAYNKPRVFLSVQKFLWIIFAMAAGGVIGFATATWTGVIEMAFIPLKFKDSCISDDCLINMGTIQKAHDFYARDQSTMLLATAITVAYAVALLIACLLAAHAKTIEDSKQPSPNKPDGHQSNRDKHHANKVIRAARRRHQREAALTHDRPPRL